MKFLIVLLALVAFATAGNDDMAKTPEAWVQAKTPEAWVQCTAKTGPCDAQADLAGYEWHPLTGSCYKFHRIALHWRAALATCHAEGGMLAVINSPTESSVVRELFNRISAATITGTQDRKYALVGFRKYEDGEWATVVGDTLAEAGFQSWSTGEPNNAGGAEYCGSIFQDGLLNDISCTKSYAYICEITPNYE